MADAAPVIIAGGGWAGLAAAVELTHLGVPVQLLESSRQLGGRARRVPFDNSGVDNGQHLLIAAYRETLRLMALTGVPAEQAFLRLPMKLQVQGASHTLQLAPPPLPAPAHLAAALLAADGLNARERLYALWMSFRLYAGNFRLADDCSVEALLKRYRQSDRIRAMLWDPICLAALNTPASRCSARLFLNVLRDTFARRRRDADLLIPRIDLGGVFPDPAMDYVESNGGHVRLGQRVTDLRVEEGRVTGVITEGGSIAAEHVILALPPHLAQRLLAPHEVLRPIADQLSALSFEPITTVYLRYPEQARLDYPMLGLHGGLGQWLFDRRVAGQPGLMAVVISGPGPHVAMDREQLAERVAEELRGHFPQWPAAEAQLVIREKRATFSCSVDVDKWRPDNATPMPGCWLAGDYTRTDYPATLEGAVRSGVECARRVAAERRRSYSTNPGN